jgi:hypothetical protein
MSQRTHCILVAAAAATAALAAPAPAYDDPFADVLVSYEPGTDANPVYADATTTLGSPERFTGEGIFPGPVTGFSPAWGADEIVSVGRGGSLVVEFATPVTDDADNPFGVDLLVFGNAGFNDASYPDAIVNGLFGNDGGTVEVSDDGVAWHLVPVLADDLYPTIGYVDVGAYDADPGVVETDFTRPVDPALAIGDFDGLGYDAVLAMYAGSGGGAGVDLADAGLASVRFVRIRNPIDAPGDVEIDAFSDVAPAAPGVPGDVDGDGVTGFQDLLLVLQAWGPCPAPPATCPADLDGNGDVSFEDLLLVLAGWTLR